MFWSHYGDEKNSPLFPFGFGLSYTHFEYSQVQLSATTLNRGESITASVEVKNTGAVKGKEVVQLYLQDPYASSIRPIKELKGFQMVDLEPGERKEVRFTITEADLKFYTAKQEWAAESGTFYLFIGSNSTIKEKQRFTLK